MFKLETIFVYLKYMRKNYGTNEGLERKLSKYCCMLYLKMRKEK